jgi:hypothetical protein
VAGRTVFSQGFSRCGGVENPSKVAVDRNVGRLEHREWVLTEGLQCGGQNMDNRGIRMGLKCWKREFD